MLITVTQVGWISLVSGFRVCWGFCPAPLRFMRSSNGKSKRFVRFDIKHVKLQLPYFWKHSHSQQSIDPAQLAMVFAEHEAVIKSADMSQEMQNEAINVAARVREVFIDNCINKKSQSSPPPCRTVQCESRSSRVDREIITTYIIKNVHKWLNPNYPYEQWYGKIVLCDGNNISWIISQWVVRSSLQFLLYHSHWNEQSLIVPMCTPTTSLA